MPITTQDIKLFASKVMRDVPEGGGGPSSTVLESGRSNNIFSDVRMQDRAGGNLSMRQVHLGITSGDVSEALGVNVIVSEPPQDPNVSIVLMETADDFARRDTDIARLEAGYVESIAYNGYLFGNHVQGMQTLSIMQRTETPVPAVGTRLALVYREGYSNKQVQYVSVQRVEHSIHVFEDTKGVFERRVVTLSLGQVLSRDYPGFDPVREWPTQASLNSGTRIRQTVWGNAAKYYGTVPLAMDGTQGAYTVKVATPYARVVPSAEAETLIADATASQQKEVLIQAGNEISYSVSAAFDTASSLYIGGAITPGTLSIIRAGAVLTDAGGALMYSGSQVGVVDYANGVCSLLTNVAGTGSITVNYKPAALVDAITSTHGVMVHAESRSKSITLTLPTLPTPGSLQVSYRVAGNWYVLQDNGDGKLQGESASTGVGMLNRTTKTVSITLSEYPDVGSMVLYGWAKEPEDLSAAPTPALDYGGNFFIPINSNGKVSMEDGEYIHPNSVNLTVGSTVITDDGNGNLVGGVGYVSYSRGLIFYTPPSLPARNTLMRLDAAVGTPSISAVSWTGNGTGSLTGVGLAGMSAGTIKIPVTLDFSWTTDHFSEGSRQYQPVVEPERVTTWVTGRGNGDLVIGEVVIGTVDPLTGAFTITAPLHGGSPSVYDLMKAVALQVTLKESWITVVPGMVGWRYYKRDAFSLGDRNGEGQVKITMGTQVISFTGSAVKNLQSIEVDSVYLQTQWFSENVRLGGISFGHGGKLYRADVVGNLVTDFNANTGVGTVVGSVGLSSGTLQLKVWQAGASNVVSDWAVRQINPVTGHGDLSDESSVYFRTASAPIRPGNFQITCTMQDGTEVIASADISGKINHGRVKGHIDYEAGFGRLLFCSPVNIGFGSIDASDLQIPGVTNIYVDAVMSSSIHYNAVAYEYIPVDPAIVGVDPVRLPSDGRVPIFQTGNYVKVHTADERAPQNVSNGQLIDLGVERLSRIVIRDAEDKDVTYGWARDLDSGKVRILTCDDWKQPVRIGWGIEHMALARDVQINGDITLNLPLTHNFPLGKSYLSSCLMLGNRFARVSLLFDQSSWDGVTYSDSLTGNAAAATYDDTAYPIEVDNTGAISERWALHVNTGGATFRVVGERVGVIVPSASFTEDCAPVNPNTGTPYFTIKAGGWHSGWAANNVLRMNTVGAGKGFCVVRAIQPGAYSTLDHRFALLTSVEMDRLPGDGEEI